MKMYVLDFGKIAMLHNNPVTVDGNAPYIPIHGFLFETGEGYVLYDTGCDMDGMEKNWPAHMRQNPYLSGDTGGVEGQLQKIGLVPDDVRAVIVSHLHLDHAGMLHKFTNARIYVDSQEFRKVLHTYAEGDFSGFHMRSDIEHWLQAELDWRFVDASSRPIPLCKDLSILDFGSGHSYGMLGMLADLGAGNRFLLAGDALYTREHYEQADMIAGIAWDREGYLRTKQQIRDLSEAYGARILFGHDCAQFASLVKIGEGNY